MPAAPDPREPLVRMLAAMQISDAEMRTLLRDASKEAEAIVKSYGDGFSSRLRAAQLDIARQQQEMWATIGNQVHVAIGDGVDAASDSMSFMMDTFMEGLGYNSTGMRYAILAQGRAGIDSLISKTANGIPLSQAVYSTSVASGQQLDRTVRAMVLNGASAREIATRVRGFINPDTPGGASYAAMRLGRSELNNAFHTTSIRLNNENPIVEAMKWNLSGSHPKPDECNAYAESSHFRGGEAGVFKKSQVPGKPHPNCLCYITPVPVSDKEFVKAFQRGDYDNWIDGQLGCSRA